MRGTISQQLSVREMVSGGMVQPGLLTAFFLKTVAKLKRLTAFKLTTLPALLTAVSAFAEIQSPWHHQQSDGRTIV
jgi:hypothetical protein